MVLSITRPSSQILILPALLAMDSFGTFTALDSVDSQLQGTQCTQADPTMSYSFDVAMFDPIWTLYPILESSHTPPFESPLLSSSSSSSFSDYETSTVDPYTSSSAGLSKYVPLHSILCNY